ncbi:hypothetical protein [Brevundimonas sp. Root1279]|uniref:hypothetical protein n=1 Tax=Brevundimonas sp. Root1279 TaxID=1736443 RepID=UPI0006FAB4FE|nr:hypothetical protein [Brevundimonas sp. Root1279]KQW78733.1 hypothetical protein ASC65_15555 [Brevundimonas sp. Root1279]
MFKFAVPAVAALGLIAIAAQSQATNTDVAVVDGLPMGWHLSHEESMAKLAYGVENSDQLALMITCEPGQAQAIVYGDVQPDSPRLVHASAGAAFIDPLSGDLSDETRIALRDPALRDLARKGRMPVTGEAGAYELTATREERRLINQFLSYCETSHV